MYEKNAADRNVTSEVYEGFWPAIEESVPVADVVTVHHVVYNVGEIKPFIEALNSHARKRIVVELPVVHPMSSWSPGWKHFWNIVRPLSPTADDFMAVLAERGIVAHKEEFIGEILLDKELEEAADYTRIRLCLPEDRIQEVRDFLAVNPSPTSRKLAVVWWDKV
jgi:hypothetical protein